MCCAVLFSILSTTPFMPLPMQTISGFSPGPLPLA
ncbi:hypothetical protein EVA_05428 [gut metagenome]|uniref:Uncharacterized protein n=1 Tax=gut metagenome TaxID=749906 RepID=J9GZR2_9ZZZZ